LALADVLFGKVNPSGRLPISFPKRIEDSPSYLFFPGFRDANYGESIFMGYRYYDTKRIEPLFAFGHGLSYTQFEYSNLHVPSTSHAGEPVVVNVDVKNVGTRAGAEVAQLYVSDQQCREPCPSHELKGFARVELQPGESRALTLILDARAFAHYDVYNEAWLTSPGRYVLSVGASSRDLRLSGEVQLSNE
jgi:beta-glucosidase